MSTTYTDFIADVLRQTSVIAHAQFGKVSGTSKAGDNNQVLTQTDMEIGSYIINQINKRYPDYNSIDEEAGVTDNKSECTWVIDPIDGTSNFANGVPLYGIMVGLLENSTPIAGGIALPEFDEMYIAEKGQGAFCNGEKIKVTKESSLSSALVAYAIDGHQENPQFTIEECALLATIILGVRNTRNSGCCFDGAMVAKGKYGAYLNRTSKIWDNVAQQIVIEEAGGLFTDFFGLPMDYTSPLEKAKENFTFCVGPPVLHQQLQDIIRADR